ncbi:MAG: tRNA pseudouridine(55) synthase TruB [Verrucomicrobiae bacterium]|nr:tRNA pseudouridine(55) synthase TruB [Verrucomicrobiae bacterium]
MLNEPMGILLVDKPGGPTSHDVVDRVRRLFQTKRVGHCGTLDPMATGLLILLIGKATKLSDSLMGEDKEYEGTLKLGIATDSQDADGEVLAEKNVPALTEEQLREAFKAFVGDLYQTPPMVSAKKIAGVPLYKLARKGKEVERKPRLIHIYRLDILRFALPEVDFRLLCTKGTYVRTICHDLGEKLGCGGHLSRLRRTASGQFRVEKARTLSELEKCGRDQLLRHLLQPLELNLPIKF